MTVEPQAGINHEKSKPTMSEEHLAQQYRNTIDIRKLKNIVWAIGILITCGTAVWGLAVRSTNRDNAETDYKKDQERQSQDMKKYFDLRLQSIRTKDSTDISTVNITVLELVKENWLKTSDEIRLLREQCKRMGRQSYSSGTLMHTFDKNGNVVPGRDRVDANLNK